MSSPTGPFARELELALQAVHRTSIVTKDVLRSLKNGVAGETKADDSPVTLADFAAQALIISAIHAVFPSDSFLGEESADALRTHHGLRSRVWDLVRSAPTVELHADGGSGNGSGSAASASSSSPLAVPESEDAMLELIDLGGKNDQTATGRVWILDPIDGTATFMEGKQYSVALCLLVDGVQRVAVTGCPNLLRDFEAPHHKIIEDQVDTEGYGVAVSAVQGEGVFLRPMLRNGLGTPRRLQPALKKEQTALNELDFVEPTPKYKTTLSVSEHKAVAELLGAPWPGTLLWSQHLKYVAVALGAVDVQVRIPTGRDRWTQIWDHAGGNLLVQESGGIVKDIDGGDFDFTQGRRLLGTRNFGSIIARPEVYEKVHEAVQEILKRRS